jgi:hypothetical protein
MVYDKMAVCTTKIDRPIKFTDPYEKNLLDEEDGMWFQDTPYALIVDSAGNVTRAYAADTLRGPLTKCAEPRAIPWKSSHGVEFRMNGKLYPSFFPINKTYVGKLTVNPPKEISVVSSIDKYCDEWYDLFYLVCGRLKGLDLEEWFARMKPCTKIGNNIATAMVKVAATRIFNEPEQSIIEIIANSVDSYASLAGKPKVGRFGMGFFSFLYYLVKHPKRCLYILTTTFDKGVNAPTTVYLRIREINENLMFSVRVVDTKTAITGTMVHLDTSGDNLTVHESDKFSDFIMNMRMITSVPIIDLTIASMVNSLPSPTTPRGTITVKYGRDGIVVTDQAGGMSLDIILNSLLIPSISTKGIKVSTQPTPYENYSSIIEERYPKLSILINRVIVVSLRIPDTTHSVNISLPSSAVLPVTRDDIVIESVQKEFVDSLNILLRLSIAQNNVTILENALNAYRAFTTNIDNRQFVDKFIAGMYSTLKNRLVISADDVAIYKEVYPQYIIGTRINANTNETILKSKVPGDTNVFANKRVVLLSRRVNVYRASPGATYSYIFVPYDIHSRKGWEKSFPMACKFDYLSAAGSANSKEMGELQKILKKYASSLDKYKDRLVHLYTTIKNAFTVKVATNGSDTLDMAIINMCLFLQYVNDMIGEDYMFECINRWMKMVASIAEPKNYGSGKRKLMSSDTSVINIVVIAPGKNTRTEKATSKLPNFTRLLKEYYNIMFDYNNYHNETHSDGVAMLYPAWYSMVFPHGSDYLYQIMTRDFSWIEASLGSYVLNLVEYGIEQKITESPAFYNQIKIVYNKHLRGRETYYAIFKNNWAFMPMYAGPAKDLKLWAEMFVKSAEIPRSVLKMEITPQFTAKQLINYVFKHDTVDFARLPYESKELVLQILEISINAGTTKPFLEATLTELIQNSMDAIRLVDPPKKTVDVKTTKIGKGLIAITIQDYVGMALENIIAISIPFYSSKKASELVTGEMGTGFFNVYRESIFILIDTVRDGQGTKFIQVPLRDDKDDVYDIITELAQGPTSRERGTGITFVVRCANEDDELNVYNRVFSFVNEVIGLMDFDGIFFNGNEVKKEKRLIYRLDELECYYCDTAPTSYILTKGVPFSPLYDFFNDKADVGVSKQLLEQFQNNVIINIRHGFYTPVQSRTRLNIEPEKLKKLNTFLFTGLARAMYERVYLTTSRYPEIGRRMDLTDEEFLNNVFRDWEYKGDLPQVVPSQIISERSISDYESMRTRWDGRSTLLYYLLPGPRGKVVNFQSLIARASEKGRTKETLNAELEKIYKDLDSYTSAPDEVVLMQKVKACLAWWMRLKYTEKAEVEQEQLIKFTKKPPNKEQISAYIQKMVDYTVRITQKYVEIFVRMANKYTRENPKVFYPTDITVSAELTKPGVGAYYQKYGRKLVLGGILRNLADPLIEFVNNIQMYIDDNGALRGNTFYQTLFGYQEPCSAVVHELEHARRGGDHDQVGTHDDVTLAIFGDASRKYIYSELANTIYLKLVEGGLIGEWLTAIKGYKI